MENKILVAVDESQNSMKAVDFVGKRMQANAMVTLFSVIPDPTAACGLDSPSLSPVFIKNRQAFCAIEDAKKDRIEAFMEKARELLIKAGFPAENVSVRIQNKKVGIARDILKEAERGKYDTIVIGRRGLSGIKQFFFGSISNKVIQLANNLAVIVVD
nr:universal stress protein [Desulfobacterales bacterium]